MYNQEIKEKYLLEVTARNVNIKQWFICKFNQLEQFEIKNGVDASEFQIEEIIEYYKYLSTTSLNSLIVLNSQMGLYSEWCIKNNFTKDRQNHYYEINNDILQGCINPLMAKAKIIDRNDLIDIIDKLPNYSDAFLILAIFEGLGGKDNTNLCDLKIEDFNGNIVKLRDGREIEVSDKLLSLARLSVEEYNFYDREGNLSKTLKYSEDDDEIIKLMNNSKEDNLLNPRRFYIRLAKISQMLGNPGISRHPLNESGRIWFIRELFEGGKYPSINQCVYENKEKIEWRYGKIQSITQYLNRYFTAE